MTQATCRSTRFSRPRTGALAALAAVPLSGCGAHGLLAPAGFVAGQQSDHLVRILLWMIPVILPLFIALPLVIWRSRLHGSGRYTPEWEFSLPLELAIWGIPVVVVAVLSWNLWTETLRFDPYDTLGADPVTVEAIAFDWKWLFIYPESGVATVNELVLPEDAPVTVRLTSGTVMQSFAIPRIGGQIYAMPGMETRMNLRTGPAGDYEGRNMQYNGDDFAHQAFAVRVVGPADYDRWMTGARKAPPLDTATLDRIAQRGTVEAPETFSAAPDTLFARFAQPTAEARP